MYCGLVSQADTQLSGFQIQIAKQIASENKVRLQLGRQKGSSDRVLNCGVSGSAPCWDKIWACMDWRKASLGCDFSCERTVVKTGSKLLCWMSASPSATALEVWPGSSWIAELTSASPFSNCPI